MNTFSNHRTRSPLTALCAAALAMALTTPVWATGTFGKVVSIGGHASDIALDEARGVLYIANYAANRVEVMNTSNQSIPRSINIPYPASLSISRDGAYLVVASYANFTTTGQPSNILTIVNLTNNTQQTISIASPPLGVAFGADGQALVLTTTDFNLLDPASGSLTTLQTITTVIASLVLPATTPNFPPQITTASLGVSGDGEVIYGITDTIGFVYSVAAQAVVSGSYTATPTLGPRLVSVNNDGSLYLAGWAAFSTKLGSFAYQFANAGGALSGGSHAIDSVAGIVYAQIPTAATAAPTPTTSTQCLPNGTCITITVPPPAGTPPATVAAPANLMICDLDNLAVRERLQIPENLAGRSILNSTRDTLYSISDSGVTVFPVGSLKQTAQVMPSQEDVVFQGAFCNRQILKQQISIVDANGGATDFRLSLLDPTLASSVSFSATSGVTPAVVTISIDPTAFQNINGTTAAYVRIDSNTAANLQPSACPAPTAPQTTWGNGCIRLLINNPDPDQKGIIVNVPGKLVDVLADPARNQFYVLRQDKNEVLVFDGTSYAQTAVLRTSNSPMQMAITPDGAYLLVGHNDAQLISVFDLNAMQAVTPIRMPSGHYPRSIAVAGGAILAASRVAGPQNQISQVDFASRTAAAFPSLGPFANSINADTVLVPAPHGAFIMAVSPDGKVLLYDANAGTFTVSRQDYTTLGGAYAASDLGQFVVDNHLLDNSLVQVGVFDLGANGSSGFAFVDASTVIRTTGPVTPGSISSVASAVLNTPGVIERVNLNNLGSVMTSTRTVELPLFPTANGGGASPGTTESAVSSFVRTLAPLSNGNAIVSMTQSGLNILSTNFDAATAQPQISNAVNTANQAGGLTGGSLVTLQGSNLSQVNASSSASPAPTTLGNSCVTVNGSIIPLFLVSPAQINGQLPLSVTSSGPVVVYTTGGVSSPFILNAQTNAPSVIQIPSAPGSSAMVPAIYRASDNLLVTLTNPVHKGDQLIIYVSGLGITTPAVNAGLPSPSNPLAVAVLTPTVTLDGVGLPVSFAGLTPGQIGVYQINVSVPQGVTQGLSIPLTVTQGAASSTVNVRVVQ